MGLHFPVFFTASSGGLGTQSHILCEKPEVHSSAVGYKMGS